MKGIILAGGAGSRLFPLTIAVSKQLLPVYDKPMIYYPLSVLLLADIRDILIISTSYDLACFQKLLGDGSQWGVHLQYAPQPSPDGLAQAFLIGKEFIGNSPVCLVLGDNIFFGEGFEMYLKRAAQLKKGGFIFGYWVSDPGRYGIVETDSNGKVLNIVEKPKAPKSNWAVPGLYFYDNAVVKIAENLEPSPRGELEITDVNLEYLKRDCLKVKLLGRGFTWFDAGTHESLLEAGTFIEAIEKRVGLKIGCPEEIVWRKGYIDDDQLRQIAKPLENNYYGQYLLQIINLSRQRR